MSGATVSINKKWPDGTLIQIGGVGAQDFLQNLAAFVSTDVADDIVRRVAASFTPGAASTPAPDVEAQAQQNIANAFPGSQPVPPPAPAPRQEAPAQAPGQAPLCNHGYAREWKAGTSKAGKPYKMWSCPADRSEQCEPIWVR